MRNYAIASAACLAAMMIGCRSYTDQVVDLKNAYSSGDLATAVSITHQKELSNAGSRDELIWHLESATVTRTAGDFSASQTSLAAADFLFENNLNKARISISRESLALFTNPATLPYRGTFYDGIMIPVYQALNCLQQGDIEGARTFVIRSYDRQREAVEFNAKRIEAERRAIASNTNSVEINASLMDSKFSKERESLFANLPDTTGYADYVNPFAVYLDGLFHLYQGVDASDRERARISMGRVASFARNNKAVLHDFAVLSSKVLNVAKAENAVYVIFETGLAPWRDENRLDLPIFSSKLSYVGAAFPVLQFVPYYVPYLLTGDASNGAPSIKTEPVCSMDRVIAHEYKNDLPGIITRAIASAAAKAAAAYTINAAAEQNGDELTSFLTKIGTACLQIAINAADTRSWVTLPKEFQVCRLTRPVSGQLAMAAPGTSPVTLNLKQGRAIVVYVRSMSPSAPMVVRQFVLKK